MTTHTTVNQELHRELDAIVEEFGLDIPSEESNDALASLNAELKGTEFAASPNESLGALGLGDDPSFEPLIFNVIKNRAKKLIEKLIALAKKYKNCPKCIAYVTAAVAAFKTGNFLSALAAGAKAVSCFRGCAK
ncbi:MAG: hypothetical protein KF833_00570 [Verrucomicrobiae bacterium]|nr:hypothetical protein [Verrucomicrobiae bacterium]